MRVDHSTSSLFPSLRHTFVFAHSLQFPHLAENANMGEPPEDVIQPVSDEDVEKFTIPAHQEKWPSPKLPIIEPEMERRVVRKLDWHLPTLMAFFCMLEAQKQLHYKDLR